MVKYLGIDLTQYLGIDSPSVIASDHGNHENDNHEKRRHPPWDAVGRCGTLWDAVAIETFPNVS